MDNRALGKVYENGEAILTQGEMGDCMYVIQEGEVEVVQNREGQEVKLAVMGPGDFFGEMSIFERETRSASVLARGRARVMTIDKRTFLTRIHEDPSLAYRIMQAMSRRIRKLDEEYSRQTRFLCKPAAEKS